MPSSISGPLPRSVAALLCAGAFAVLTPAVAVASPGIGVVKAPSATEVHVGDTVTYTFTVTNTGDVPLTVQVTDVKCDIGTLAGPTGDTSNDGKLGVTETWVYSCTHLVTAGDGDPLHNVVTVTGDDGVGGTPTDNDSADVDILHPGIHLVKGADVSQARVGDAVAYTFTITNTGDTRLTASLTDLKCDTGTLSGPTGDSNSNGKLDISETWIYHCTHVVTTADGDPLHNTATADGTDAIGGQVSDPGSADVDVLRTAMKLAKSGPATAEAGQRVPYSLVLTNTGETPIVGATLLVTDVLCDSAPMLVDRGGDQTGATLDPGDAWTFGCSVQSQVGQAAIENSAQADGFDTGGHGAAATGTATTTLVQPQAPPTQTPPATVPGSARLAGPTRCVSGPFKVRVIGRRIARVTFRVDRRLVKTLRDPAGEATKLVARINPRHRPGTHRLDAKVVFNASSNTRTRTLHLRFRLCGRHRS